MACTIGESGSGGAGGGAGAYFCDLAAVTVVPVTAADVDSVAGDNTVIAAAGDPGCGLSPSLETNFPVGPQAPDISGVSLESLPEPPALDAVRPSISNIAIPDPLSLTFPQAPDLQDTAAITAPDYVLPATPSFDELQIPDTVVLNLPEFTDELRDLPSFGDVEIIWNDAIYESTILDTVNSKLIDEIQNSRIGIPDAVQASLWQRARERQEAMYAGVVSRVKEITESRGLSLPGATLNLVTNRALQTLQNRRADLERDVELQVEELKQKNYRTSMANAVKLESKLVSAYSSRMARELKAKVETLKTTIKVFNAEVSLYDADAKAFAVKVEVFRTLIQAELAKLEVFRTDLARLKSLASLNESKARLYEAQVQGVITVVDVFKSQVAAAKLQAEANASRVDVFKTEIKAFEARVLANAQEFEVFKSRVQAEAAKVQGYLSETRAFGSEASAYKNLVDAKIRGYELQAKQTQEIPLELLKINTEVYKSFVEAEAEKLKAATAAIKSKVECYKAHADSVIGTDRVKVEIANTRADVAAAEADLASTSALISARNVVASAGIQEADIRFRGQISGQRAAALAGQESCSENIILSNTQSTSVSRNKTTTDAKSEDSRSNDTVNESTTNTHIFSQKI
jgi:hypothetical protein